MAIQENKHLLENLFTDSTVTLAGMEMIMYWNSLEASQSLLVNMQLYLPCLFSSITFSALLFFGQGRSVHYDPRIFYLHHSMFATLAIM